MQSEQLLMKNELAISELERMISKNEDKPRIIIEKILIELSTCNSYLSTLGHCVYFNSLLNNPDVSVYNTKFGETKPRRLLKRIEKTLNNTFIKNNESPVKQLTKLYSDLLNLNKNLLYTEISIKEI